MLILSLLLAVQADPLADLIRASAELRSFRATWELTGSMTAGATRIQVEYVAPDRVRVERTLGLERSSMWCVDGVVVLSAEGEHPLHGRADSRAAYAELAPTEQALRAAFPDAPARGPSAASVRMHWSMEPKTRQAGFSIEAQFDDERGTPLGWLETLRQKRATAREDGDVLRFETDGAFEIVLSKQSGFVERFSGQGPQGDLKLVLESLERDVNVEAARFEPPSPVPGARDVSADLLRAVQRSADVGMRERIYAASAGPDSPREWDEAFEARLAPVLRTFHERTVSRTLEPLLAPWNKIRDNVAQRLADLRKEGKSAEVDALRRRERGNLEKQLEELEKKLLTRLVVPPRAESLPRAAELLALESRVAAAAFRATIREPMLASYDAATGQD